MYEIKKILNFREISGLCKGILIDGNFHYDYGGKHTCTDTDGIRILLCDKCIKKLSQDQINILIEIQRKEEISFKDKIKQLEGGENNV